MKRAKKLRECNACVYSQLWRVKPVNISCRNESSQTDFRKRAVTRDNSQGFEEAWRGTLAVNASCSAIENGRRATGEPEPNDDNRRKHGSSTDRDPIEKIEENDAHIHENIVQLLTTLRDITMMLVRGCELELNSLNARWR